MKISQTIVTTVGECLQDIIDSLYIHIENLEIDNEYDEDNITDNKELKSDIPVRKKVIKDAEKIIDDIQKLIQKTKNIPYNYDKDGDKLEDVQVCHEIYNEVTGIKN